MGIIKKMGPSGLPIQCPEMGWAVVEKMKTLSKR